MQLLQTLLKIFLFLISFQFGFGQTVTPKLKITYLRENFYVFTTYNMYKGNSVSANGMYLVTDKGVVMFDTPWDTTQFQPLIDSIQIKHNKEVVICIATHSHKDKTAGLEFLKKRGVNTFTTRDTDSISKIKREKRAEFLLAKDSIFTVGQYNFQTYYPGPGHTPDNIVIWFEKEKVLYGGCLVKSVEATDLGNMEDGNLKEYPATIKNLQVKFQHPGYIITGHQSWNNNTSLEHTLNLIKAYK
ncbi:MAG: BlaB/IND/MUS family subclass B1 metallo-beta-lactamase [Bacteroidota bacterium]